MSLLEARALRFGYDAHRVLDAVDLTISPGTLTAVVGPNGAGKSTLLRLLAGILQPSSGQVLLDGQPLHVLGPRALSKRLAVVLDPPEMGHAWTALELVVMGRAPHLRFGRFEGSDDVQKALSALTAVASADLGPRVFAELSAGERQRVLLARALCQDTPILLLDEPTSHLDPAHALRVGTLCRDRASEGQAIVWVVHDLNLAARFADQLAVLHAGRIVATGAPAAVLTPDRIAAVYGVQSRRVGAEDGAPAWVFDALIDDD